MGRPSTYTDEVAARISERIAKGEPLAVICRDEDMPAVRTVYDWQAAHPDFSADIALARAEGFDALAAECLDIADNIVSDTKWVGEEGSERPVPDAEWISRSKLRIETRLKLLSKWDPKRYGDKVTLTGGDPASGDQPIQHAITVRLV